MSNLPIKLFRSAQVRELDRLAIQSGISGFELMTRAGQAVFECLHRCWPEAGSVAVYCGAGNNAGDGYIVARMALQSGLRVSVHALAAPEKLKGDALQAYKNYSAVGGIVTLFEPGRLISADVIVDALFGTGLDRQVAGLYAEAIDGINRQNCSVVAVDIPSGLNADTGAVMGCAVQADCTVSFIGLKQGLMTGDAPAYCGAISYTSLAVPEVILAAVPASAERVVNTPWPRRNRCAHKGEYGHVLIVGGDMGYSGAARLAGEAALRVGAGLVSVATRREHAAVLNSARPELMCRGVDSAGQMAALLEKANIVVLGPGLGQSGWAQDLFEAVLTSGKRIVIDADGLNMLAQMPKKNADCILTPHPGEAARLLDCTTSEIQRDRFAAAAAIQARYGGVVVLKGAGTLIVTDDSTAISTTGNPGMASGGMGDVLSGVIAGLLAQGFSLKNAARQGVYGHGYAADLAAQKGGEKGLLASDLMPYLRQWANE